MASSLATSFILLMVSSKFGISIPSSSTWHRVKPFFCAMYARIRSGAMQSSLAYLSLLITLALLSNLELNMIRMLSSFAHESRQQSCQLAG